MAAAPDPQDAMRREPPSQPRLEYQLIDNKSQIKPALDQICQSTSVLAVDCEGENLSRDGKLAIVSIATADDIYLFDIKELGADVFDKGLRSILEDTSRDKIMFDCREDSDCLWHKFNVRLANVLDLQLMKIIRSENFPDPFSQGPDVKVRNLPSCLQCLKDHVNDNDLIAAKEAVKPSQLSTGIWMARPLNKTLLKYAACDVRGFFKLFRHLRNDLDEQEMGRLRIASDIYLDFQRGRATRQYNKYESNQYLPLCVIPARPFPVRDTLCKSCERNLLYLGLGQRICAVCSRLDESSQPRPAGTIN